MTAFDYVNAHPWWTLVYLGTIVQGLHYGVFSWRSK